MAEQAESTPESEIRPKVEVQPKGEVRPKVEVRRSSRRKRTVTAYRELDTIVVLIPGRMSAGEEQKWVDQMVRRVLAKEAVVVAKGAANGLSYEAAINQRDVTFGVMPQGRRVFQAAYHGMAGMPDVEVRMQAYKMCSGEAAKENDSLRRSTPTR